MGIGGMGLCIGGISKLEDRLWIGLLREWDYIFRGRF